MADKNLAAVLHGPMDLRLENVDIPEPGFNEVLLQMGSVGICGSDIKYWKYGKCGVFVLKDPMIVGHEASGTVLRAGEGVKHLKKGDRVAVEPGVPCRTCKLCKTGQYNLCKRMEFCATPPVNGNISRLYKHPADFCFRLPNNVSLDEGALLEPLAVAIYACRRGNVSLGSNVLICGAGPVGVLTLMAAKQMGAASVIVTDIDQERLDFARSKGADYLINVNSIDPKEFASYVTKKAGYEPDVTIECSGTDFSFCLGIYATYPGGCVVLVGRGQCNTPIPYNIAATKQIDIKGVFRYANCYPAALEMVSSKKVDMTDLVTHRFAIGETEKAFQTADDRSQKAIKVIIDCNKNV